MDSDNQDNRDQTNWRFSELVDQLSAERPFIELADFDGEVSIELYKPLGEDKQSPHTRDELYIVVSGTGRFTLGDEQFPFAPGDAIFVPALEPHKFSTFSDDFATWVIFFGSEKSAP